MSIIQKYLERKITEVITRTFKDRGKIVPPSGFIAAEQFRGCTEEWVTIPFGGTPVLVKLRVLGAGEYPPVTLLAFVNETRKLETIQDKIDFKNTLEHYTRHALVDPSFEFFETEVWGKQGAVKKMKADMETLKEKSQLYELSPLEERELEDLELSLGYCLPLDAMRAIAGWCECLDLIDMKRVTKEDLIMAYWLSQKYHNRASDNINGTFLEHSRREFDIVAARLYHDKYGTGTTTLKGKDRKEMIHGRCKL